MKTLLPFFLSAVSLLCIGYFVGYNAGKERGRIQCNTIRMMEYNARQEFEPMQFGDGTSDSMIYYKMEMLELNDTY